MYTWKRAGRRFAGVSQGRAPSRGAGHSTLGGVHVWAATNAEWKDGLSGGALHFAPAIPWHSLPRQSIGPPQPPSQLHIAEMGTRSSMLLLQYGPVRDANTTRVCRPPVLIGFVAPRVAKPDSQAPRGLGVLRRVCTWWSSEKGSHVCMKDGWPKYEQ